jgi:hypothetical protein
MDKQVAKINSAGALASLNLRADSGKGAEMRGIKYRLSNGNYIEKTMYFFIIAMVDDTPRKAVITMRSSNLTPARKLNDLISNLRMTDDKGSFQPAAYSAVFKLQTAEKNAGDKTWHVYKPSMVRMLDVSNEKDAAIYMMAQEFQKQVSTGVSKPKYEKVEEGKSEDII